MTLPVINEADEDLTIALDDQSESITVPVTGDRRADLSAAYLRSKDFQSLLISGRLRFVYIQHPTNEQYRLGRTIFPGLIRRHAGALVSLHTGMSTATENLAKKWDAYNKTWDAVEEILVKAESSANGADYLLRGAEHFLNTRPEEAAVEEIETEIAEIMAEDTTDPEFDLEDWYERRSTKEEELAKVQERLKTAQRLYEAPFQAIIEDLDEAHRAFVDTDPSTSIGAKIPDW